MTVLMIILTILFTVQFITQFNSSMRRINTRAKIRTGRLSYNDIVRISAKQFNDRQWLRGGFIRSGRFYLSSNGRLYKRINNNGHTTIEFYSLSTAIFRVQFYSRYDSEKCCLTSYGSSNNWTIYRPGAAML